ncbi:MAG: hypothetical protein EOO60_08780 [Hymenobacter sp.]|nr:MAG: hypothetical protein EOO60_08780 [Hymenobacter sp.]
MKNSLFFALCGFALLASSNVALAQNTPPPAYANCAGNDQDCWEKAGGTQGGYYASGHSADESSAEGVRATNYATYYANQPYSESNNDLNRYWNGYADAITDYNEHRYYGF